MIQPRSWGALLKLLCSLVVAVGVAGSASVFAQSSPCPSVKDLRVMIFVSQFNQMLTYVAKDGGFFDKNCLNVSFQVVNSGPAGMAQLESGSLDISDSAFDNVLIARNRGLPVRIVAGVSSLIPYSLVANKDLQLSSSGYPAVMNDLVGKKIGVYARGSGSENFVKTLLRGAKVNPESVTFVAVGGAPSQLAGLQNNAVDAVIMADPAQEIAVQTGIGKYVVDLRVPNTGPDVIKNLKGSFEVTVTSEAFIRDHPDVLAHYVKAMGEAAKWTRNPANFAALEKLMRGRVSLSKDMANGDELFTKLVKLYAQYSSAALPRQSLTAWNELQLAGGNIPAPLKADDVIWSGAPQE